MSQVILIAHVIVSICIIGLVMMQQGKGADAGAAFGGGGSGGSGSLFGASGAGTFLSRATAVFAVMFFATSLGLAYLSGHQEEPVDLMDVDSAFFNKELADLPFIEDAAQEAPVVQETLEDVPVAIDQDMVNEQINEIMDEAMPVIEESVEIVIEEGMPTPAIGN